MSNQEQFDSLKQQFIKDTLRQIEQLKEVSFTDLTNNTIRTTITDHRSEAVDSSVQLYHFINQLRRTEIDQKLTQLQQQQRRLAGGGK